MSGNVNGQKESTFFLNRCIETKSLKDVTRKKATLIKQQFEQRYIRAEHCSKFSPYLRNPSRIVRLKKQQDWNLKKSVLRKWTRVIFTATELRCLIFCSLVFEASLRDLHKWYYKLGTYECHLRYILVWTLMTDEKVLARQYALLLRRDAQFW